MNQGSMSNSSVAVLSALVLSVTCAAGQDVGESSDAAFQLYFRARYGSPDAPLPRQEIVKRCLEDIEFFAALVPGEGRHMPYYADVVDLLLRNADAGTLPRVEACLRRCDAAIHDPKWQGSCSAVLGQFVALSKVFAKVSFDSLPEDEFGKIFVRFLSRVESVPLSVYALKPFADKVGGSTTRAMLYEMIWANKVTEDRDRIELLRELFRSPGIWPTEDELARVLDSPAHWVQFEAQAFCLSSWPDLRMPQNRLLRMLQSEDYDVVGSSAGWLADYLGSSISPGRRDELFIALDRRISEIEQMWEKGQSLKGEGKRERMLAIVSNPLGVICHSGDAAYVKSKADLLLRHCAWLETAAREIGHGFFLATAVRDRRRLEEIMAGK